MNKPLTIAGALLILLGSYGLFRPNVLMPAQKRDLQIAGQRVVMETRRVVEVPRPFSSLIIVCGIGVILMAIPKRQHP